MSSLYQNLIDRIRNELSDLEQVIERAQEGWSGVQTASAKERQAFVDSVALNLHGFYSGLERLFELIARQVDGSLPEGATWHRDLLQQMVQDFPQSRPAVISQENSVLDFGWMEQLGGERPYLFLAEGLFMYLPLEDVKALVLKLQERFPGCELVCEVFNKSWLRGWRGRTMKRKLQNNMSMGSGAMFQSGIDDSDSMEQWRSGIHFLDDWSFVDADEPKLGALRLMRHWAMFRKLQWVVHYRLDEPT